MSLCQQAKQTPGQQPKNTSTASDLAKKKELSELDSSYDPHRSSQAPSLTDGSSRPSSVYSSEGTGHRCVFALHPSPLTCNKTLSGCVHDCGTHHEPSIKGVSLELRERDLQCTPGVPIQSNLAQRCRPTASTEDVKNVEIGAGVGDDRESTDCNSNSEDDSDDDTDDDNGEWSGANNYYESAILQAVFPDLELAADMITRMYSKLYPGSSKSITRKISAWQERVNTSVGTTEKGESSTGKAPSSSSTSTTTRRDNKKRERQSGSTYENIGEDDEEEEEDTDGSRHKKFKDNKYGSGPAIPTFKLACPFFKMNPSKYCVQLSREGKNDKYYRICPGPGFRTITLLKEHLKRKHSPVQCNRCYRIFEVKRGDRSAAVSEFENHLQLDERCPRNSPSMKEGISDSQWAALDEKKTRKGKGTSAEKPKSDVEKWKDIWVVLFPKIPPPSTPWYDSFATEFLPSSPVQGLHRFLDVHEQMLESKLPTIKAAYSDNELKNLLEELARKSFQLWSATCRWGESTSISGSDLLSSWEKLSSHISTGQHSSPKVSSTPVFANLEGIEESSTSSRINDTTRVRRNHNTIPQNTPRPNHNGVSPTLQGTMNVTGDFTSVEMTGAELHTLPHNEYLADMNGIQNSGRWYDPMQFNGTANFDGVDIGSNMHANMLNVGGAMSQNMPTVYSQWDDDFTHPIHGRYGAGP